MCTSDTDCSFDWKWWGSYWIDSNEYCSVFESPIFWISITLILIVNIFCCVISCWVLYQSRKQRQKDRETALYVGTPVEYSGWGQRIDQNSNHQPQNYNSVPIRNPSSNNGMNPSINQYKKLNDANYLPPKLYGIGGSACTSSDTPVSSGQGRPLQMYAFPVVLDPQYPANAA